MWDFRKAAQRLIQCSGVSVIRLMRQFVLWKQTIECSDVVMGAPIDRI